MGIAEQADPVRCQIERRLDGGQHSRDGLIGQAAYEVDVDRADAGAAQRLGDRLGVVDGPGPVDRPLDLNVDDLQAEAGPVDPDPRHGLDQVLVELARVVLDRDVGIGRRVEACPQALEQPLPIGRLQDRWRAAAQVHVANLGAPGGCTWQAGWWPSPFS